MSDIAYPFLTLDHSSVNAEPWESLDPEGWDKPVSDIAETWDYNSDLTITRKIKINREIAAIQLDIPIDSLNLQLWVRAGTGSGNLPRIWLKSKAFDSWGESVQIDYFVRGGDLSNRLFLETTIIVLPSENSGALSPSLPASKVWQDHLDIRLEGSEPRFPIELVSFSKLFASRPEINALWYLDWVPGEMTRDFSGSVRLLINKDQEHFAERFVSGDRYTLQVIMADVMSQIITSAIQLPDPFETLEACEFGTVGSYALYWINICFPGLRSETIRSSLEHTPSRFHAAILSNADIGEVS